MSDCPHTAATNTRQVCRHLQETPDGDYVKAFTGVGRDYRLICLACNKEPDLEAIPWRTVCDACFAGIESEGCWDGVRGTMEVSEEPAPLIFQHRIVMEAPRDLRLIQPIPEAKVSLWMALTAAGELLEIDLATGSRNPITRIEASDLDLTPPISLVRSPDGKYLCLMQTLGDQGIVIERDTERRTLRLKRDGYHSDVSPFPAAFVVHEGRTLLIHSTGWNRLDVSVPDTGELLTERSPTSYRSGEQRPPHYLDYFHGRLFPSPNNDLIVDDGWVWHPVGIVRAWSVDRWLRENVWESEDGPSVRNLAQREYFWGGPLCWIDDSTLALWGYGTYDEHLLPAARLFDAISGKEMDWFPGPEVAPGTDRDWRDRLADPGGQLFFDRYLFATSERFGISVWDHRKGACLHRDASFSPIAYHPATKEFLTILPNGDLRLSILTEQDEPNP